MKYINKMININEYITEKLHINKDIEIKKILKDEGNGDVNYHNFNGFLFNSWNSGRFTFMSEYCKYFIKHSDEFDINDDDISSLKSLENNFKYLDIKSLKNPHNQKIIYDIINCVLNYNIGPLTIPRTNKLKKILSELSNIEIKVLDNLTWN